jgi:hypothetical protein
VKPSYGERLINVCGQVNGREILFVKDTGTEMTLIREEYVDSSNIIEGQRILLSTLLCNLTFSLDDDSFGEIVGKM